MIRQVTRQEADKLSAGLHGLMSHPDSAALLVGRDLREKARVKIWRQDWLAADGSRVSHIEVRVPCADMVLVSDGNDMGDWWAACREIHGVLEMLVGEPAPEMASRHHLGYWHGDETFAVGDQPVALCQEHEHDFANLCLRAWSNWK